ncbi:SIMPL domain-containing protein [Nocardioides sp. cx-169]|uniref:SIMPL domain-containing protein n=1 Tax=Nocardioides sp. cx-169 TaxID=2899080 RepID=UPI001E658A03|nr:SIMPL domain-containing protein [Nocardioides sp. cx-169]MCD4534726.1 SIMPL domain-containing protein [Nocardioides sp. cx-169]
MRTVTVSGHGVATAHPDSAVVRVAAVHRGATLADALAGAARAAYADARARAEHLAGLAGVTLGDVQAIVEGAAAGLSAQRGEVGAAYSSTLDLTLEPGRSSLAQALTVAWAVV